MVMKCGDAHIISDACGVFCVHRSRILTLILCGLFLDVLEVKSPVPDADEEAHVAAAEPSCRRCNKYTHLFTAYRSTLGASSLDKRNIQTVVMLDKAIIVSGRITENPEATM